MPLSSPEQQLGAAGHGSVDEPPLVRDCAEAGSLGSTERGQEVTGGSELIVCGRIDSVRRSGLPRVDDHAARVAKRSAASRVLDEGVVVNEVAEDAVEDRPHAGGAGIEENLRARIREPVAVAGAAEVGREIALRRARERGADDPRRAGKDVVKVADASSRLCHREERDGAYRESALLLAGGDRRIRL